MIGAAIGLIGVISLVVFFPAAEQISPASPIVVVVFAGLNAVWAALWCVRPWPTRRQSRVFVITSDIGIAGVALIGSNWIMGLFVLNCFALVSVYLVFFDGPKSPTLHTILLLLTTMIFIVLTSARSDTDSGVLTGTTLGAVIPVTTTPLGIQLGIRTLRIDANESATDPVTGNRPGCPRRFETAWTSDLFESLTRITTARNGRGRSGGRHGRLPVRTSNAEQAMSTTRW
ncbi:hypothetical protein [Mycolicibacterium mageritense]|uniref:hypothetical protein n=1 Tax=Mycolicibacterium mageritense TaxID=53462 RepID=UPI001E4B782E|nr:hypothetical protein [Mycolicibacterium mageritense]